MTPIFSFDIEKRYQLSFWDSLIVAAAVKANASVIYSEDFNHGQLIASIEIRNPFISETPA